LQGAARSTEPRAPRQRLRPQRRSNHGRRDQARPRGHLFWGSLPGSDRRQLGHALCGRREGSGAVWQRRVTPNWRSCTRTNPINTPARCRSSCRIPGSRAADWAPNASGLVTRSAVDRSLPDPLHYARVITRAPEPGHPGQERVSTLRASETLTRPRSRCKNTRSRGGSARVAADSSAQPRRRDLQRGRSGLRRVGNVTVGRRQVHASAFASTGPLPETTAISWPSTCPARMRDVVRFLAAGWASPRRRSAVGRARARLLSTRGGKRQDLG